MGLKTGLIRYNVNERGRKYTGTPRRFNVPKFVAVTNGRQVQEMVAKRDLYGYLGHDIRRRFGLYPPETVLENGAVVPIEPAFVTTYLKAYDDGTVEHEAEFLDTPLGRTAQSWFEKKIGGFSSVIAPSEQDPSMNWGFDYVNSPNFDGNRGYVMDSAAQAWEMNRLTSKQKAEWYQARQMEQQAVMDALLQGVCDQNELMRLNRQLAATIDCLANQQEETQRQLAEIQAAYDAVRPEFQPVVRLNVRDENWLQLSVAVMDDIKEQKLVAGGNRQSGFDPMKAFCR